MRYIYRGAFGHDKKEVDITRTRGIVQIWTFRGRGVSVEPGLVGFPFVQFPRREDRQLLYSSRVTSGPGVKYRARNRVFTIRKLRVVVA